jgi:hypothetical protein
MSCYGGVSPPPLATMHHAFTPGVAEADLSAWLLPWWASKARWSQKGAAGRQAETKFTSNYSQTLELRTIRNLWPKPRVGYIWAGAPRR